jgi:glutamate mutase epsilon subunit
MTSYGAKIASIPNRLETLLDLYDEGQLPPDEQIKLAQELIDLDLDDYLTQYQQFCDYCIAEGMCYDVEVGDTESS